MKYRKKPVIVDAWQYVESAIPTLKQIIPPSFKPRWLTQRVIDISDNAEIELKENFNTPKWFIDAFKNETIDFNYHKSSFSLFISTLEGNMELKVGDYIIRGVKGELYPCRADIFEETYEPVEE